MKTIDEMNHEEILALTDGQVNVLIDYECALEGKPLLPPMPVAPQKVEIEPDILVYEVGGVTTTCPDHAAKILAAIETGDQWETEYVSGYSGTRRLRPTDYYHKAKIETRKVFSVEKWDEMKNAINQYEATKKSYEEAKKEYDDAANDRVQISERIWNTVSHFRNEEFRRRHLRNEFSRYLELAEGNHTIAMNFLKKAHEVPLDLELELNPPVEYVDSVPYEGD